MWLEFRSGADSGKRVQVQGSRFTVGREGPVNLVVPDPKVSRNHAYFQDLGGGRVALYDLGSSNGTFVNGQRVTQTGVTLSGNEQVQFGDTVLQASAAPQQAPAQQQPPVQQPATPTPTSSAPIPGAPPQRTQSAIQRIIIQRQLTRATRIGIAAIILLLVAIAVGALAILSGGDSDKAPTTAEVVEDVTPLTTFIAAEDAAGRSRGTGWIYSAKDGFVVTNAHVVAGAGRQYQVGITTEGGKQELRPAQIVGCRLSEDMAVLQIADKSGLNQFKIADQSKLKRGEDVVAVGYPEIGSGFDSVELVGTTGVVSVPKTTFPSIPISESVIVGPYQNVVQTDAAINPGNSGGPLVNHQNELVGINSAGRPMNEGGTPLEGQNYAIGTDRVKQIVPELVRTKSNDCG